MKNQQTDETTKDIQNPSKREDGDAPPPPKADTDVRDQDRTKDLTRDQGRERREHVAGDKGSDR